MRKLILGSSSKWRAKVLSGAGVPFTQMSPDIDEKAIRDADPYKLTRRIATAKAAALLPRINVPAFLVTSDQVVTFDGDIREKPRDAAQASRWLTEYRGKRLYCITSVVVVDTVTGLPHCGADAVTCEFAFFPLPIIDRMLRQKDAAALQSAGAFVHEHPLIAPHVRCFRESPDGSDGAREEAWARGSSHDVLTSVSGLPLAKTLKLLAEIGWGTEE